MKPNAHGYLMCNNKNLVSFHVAIESAGFKVFKTLIWAKNNAVTNQYYMDSHEYIIFFRKGKAKKINNCGTKSVLYFDNPRNKVHPSEKPVDLLKVLIENSTSIGDTVLDFAMGSGSTGVACCDSGREFIGIEIDKKFFKIAEDRIFGRLF
jgi:site-specific DNA-methyltransferase (adenine-specific)